MPLALFGQTGDPAADAGSAAPAQTPLAGTVQGNRYLAPTGAYSVEIPIYKELGGTITDTPYVVTFQDSFSTHISIAAFPQDATERWKLETNGPKEYLKDFFLHYVARDFLRGNKHAKVQENARFVPTILNGAFVAYILLPGGSMFFNANYAIAANSQVPTAKRGNMIFVKNGYLYVLSTELAERATEGTAYHKTEQEEDEILRERLIDVTRKMQFAPAPASASAPAPITVPNATK
jgi:hypothetical protein